MNLLRRLRNHPMGPIALLFTATIFAVVLAAALLRARNDGLASGLEVFVRVGVTAVYVAIVLAVVVLVLALAVFVLTVPGRVLRAVRRRRADDAP